MAGYSASIKLNNMVITSLTTLGNGISNFTAQNLGAAQYDRIRSGFRAGLKLVFSLCVPLALLYEFAGRLLLRIFLDNPSGVAMESGTLFCVSSPPSTSLSRQNSSPTAFCAAQG